MLREVIVIKSEVSIFLEEYRLSKGLTIEEFAETQDLSVDSLKGWMSGKNIPSLASARRFFGEDIASYNEYIRRYSKYYKKEKKQKKLAPAEKPFFENAPIKGFNLLSSDSNRDLNARCLIEVYRLLEQELTGQLSYSLLQDDVASFLVHNSLTDAEEFSGQQSARDKAGIVLRKFTDSEIGWIAETMDDATCEKMITMTDFGSSLSRYLEGLIHVEREEYSVFVTTVLNLLERVEQWKDNPYTQALKPVHKGIRDLSFGLKRLNSSLKDQVESLIAEDDDLQKLITNFNNYFSGNLIKEFSRLIRHQSSYDFPIRFCRLIQPLETDFHIRIIEEYSAEKGCSLEDADAEISSLINQIRRFVLGEYKRTLESISLRTFEYIEVAYSRLQLRNRTGAISKSVFEDCLLKLQNIKATADAYFGDELIDTDAESIEFIPSEIIHTGGYIDIFSLRRPTENLPPIRATETEDVFDISDEIIDREKDAIAKSAIVKYNKGKAKMYVDSHMRDKKSIKVSEFDIQTTEEALTAISSAAYADENGFIITPTGTFFTNNGITMSDFAITRADKKE